MARKPERLSDQMRAIINGCGVSRYRLWKDTGIAQSSLSRFMRCERSLSQASLDTLGEYLGLRIVVDKPKAKKKG